MTRVKVCGLTRERDLRAAAAAGADALGVVCDVPVETPREVSPGRAADLVAAAPPFATTVLVTMPESATAAVDLARRVGADAVQLHGDLSPDAVADVRQTVGTVLVATDHEGAPAYAEHADALVVDSVDESGAGGTGRTHDWARTREVVESLSVPVVLAGGLTPGNVERAVRTVGPYGVDVASGVESAGGRKDHDAVRSFVRRAHAASEDDREVEA